MSSISFKSVATGRIQSYCISVSEIDSRRKTAPRCERVLTVVGLAPVSACHRTLEAIGPATSNSFATLRPGSQGAWRVQPALLRKAVSSRGSCFNGRMLVGDYRGNNARACACPPMLSNSPEQQRLNKSRNPATTSQRPEQAPRDVVSIRSRAGSATMFTAVQQYNLALLLPL